MPVSDASATSCRRRDSGKCAFVEKPLAISTGERDEIESTYAGLAHVPLLTVGFNRGFAPHMERRMCMLFAGLRSPRPWSLGGQRWRRSRWTLGAGSGGGRIVGEACHFTDLLRYLAGLPRPAARRRDRPGLCVHGHERPRSLVRDDDWVRYLRSYEDPLFLISKPDL